LQNIPQTMNQLIQTVNDSVMDLVGRGIQLIPAIFAAIIIMLITRYSLRPIRRLTRAVSEKLTDNLSLQLLALQMVTVGVWIVGILAASIVLFPGLALGDLIALLGLSSVAVGFAFQDIFKNFLAGILLLVDQPFQVNDQIVVTDYEGTVKNIAIRATEIENYQGEIIVIPNSILFTNSVQVMTQNPTRRTDLAIGLDYNTPLDPAREVLQRAVEQVDGVLASPTPEVDIVGFGDSAIDFIVRYWTRPQIAMVRRTKTRVMVALKAACDQAEFNIPYPIRTTYFFDQTRFDDHYPVGHGDGAKTG
jgi:small conductance mechanosensitive channel